VNELEQYEWRAESGLASYREWLIPAALVNKFAVVEIVDENEPCDDPPVSLGP
jgi:hypothetical protein